MKTKTEEFGVTVIYYLIISFIHHQFVVVLTIIIATVQLKVTQTEIIHFVNLIELLIVIWSD